MYNTVYNTLIIIRRPALCGSQSERFCCWISKLDRPFPSAFGSFGSRLWRATIGFRPSCLRPLAEGDRPFETSPPLPLAHRLISFSRYRCSALRNVLKRSDGHHLYLPVQCMDVRSFLNSSQAGVGAASAYHVCSANTQLWTIEPSADTYWLHLFGVKYL